MGRLFYNLTTVVLIAAVLAGSLLSPGVRHAHSQGDVPHSHDSAVVSHDEHHGHAHDEPHASRGSQHQHSEIPASGGLIDFVSHWHISLLGIEFTLPQDGESGEPTTQHDGELVVFRLTPDVVVSVAAGLADLVGLSSGSAISVDRVDVASSGFANASASQVDRILLCDTARCERSGVLLI